MKNFFLLLFLLGILSPLAEAFEARDCNIQNSQTPLFVHSLSFETLSDIFTLTNAKTLNVKTTEEDMRFFRTAIDVQDKTYMIFVQRKNWKALRTAHVEINSTPRFVFMNRELFGRMTIVNTGEISPIVDLRFHCLF
jgi:hypothetical protein